MFTLHKSGWKSDTHWSTCLTWLKVYEQKKGANRKHYTENSSIDDWCRVYVSVSIRVWLLQKGGGSSSGRCCVQVPSQRRSSWEASLANPSLSLLSVHCCPRRRSSTKLCGAEEVNSSSPFELLCCAAPPSDRLDFGFSVWTRLLSSWPRLRSRIPWTPAGGSSSPVIPVGVIAVLA